MATADAVERGDGSDDQQKLGRRHSTSHPRPHVGVSGSDNLG